MNALHGLRRCAAACGGVGWLLLAASLHGQIAVGGQAGVVDRRLSTLGAVEHQSGLVGGALLGVGFGHVRVALTGSGGTLSGADARSPGVDYAALSADVTLAVGPSLIVRSGIRVHAYASPLGTQRWVLPHVGAEVLVPFRGVPAQTALGGDLIVGAATAGVEKPSGGMALTARLEAGAGAVRGFVGYRFERLNFPGTAGRDEQTSAVLIGLRLGG